MNNGKGAGGVKGSKGIGGDCFVCGKTVNPGPCWCPGCQKGCCTKVTGSGSCCTIDSCKTKCCQNGLGCCHCSSQPDQCEKDSCKCYISAYRKTGDSKTPEGEFYWPTISDDPSKVHLLVRIFLGSVCLIWSGLSQLGFLTKEGSDKETRWKDSNLHEIDGTNAGLGSFMAAMGYDLDRLNQGGSSGGE